MCLGTLHLKFLDATIGHVQHILEFLSVCGGGGGEWGAGVKMNA